jgi:siroheme synthase
MQRAMKKEVVVIEIGANDLDFLTIKALKVLEKVKLVVVKDEIHSEIISVIKASSKIIYSKKDSTESIVDSKMGSIAILTTRSLFELPEVEKLTQLNYDISAIPSVKPYLAYAGVNKVPITKRGVNLGFLVVKESINSEQLDNYISIAVSTNASIVFCNNFSLLGEIVWKLKFKEKSDMPIAIVNPVGKKGEWLSGTIETIEELSLLNKMPESSLIIVGEVVNQYNKEGIKEFEETFINKI